MAIAGAHLSVMMLTSHLNNLNYRLTQIADKRQAITMQESALIEEYSLNSAKALNTVSSISMTTITNALASGNTSDLQTALNSMVAASSTSSSSWTNDPDIKLLQLQDNDFDMQQKKMETDVKATTANLESQQKLLDNNIKKDFAGNLSI